MKKQKYQTRESIIRAHNKKRDALIKKFNHFEITKKAYVSRSTKLDKSLVKKLGV